MHLFDLKKKPSIYISTVMVRCNSVKDIARYDLKECGTYRQGWRKVKWQGRERASSLLGSSCSSDAALWLQSSWVLLIFMSSLAWACIFLTKCHWISLINTSGIQSQRVNRVSEGGCTSKGISKNQVLTWAGNSPDSVCLQSHFNLINCLSSLSAGGFKGVKALWHSNHCINHLSCGR